MGVTYSLLQVDIENFQTVVEEIRTLDLTNAVEIINFLQRHGAGAEGHREEILTEIDELASDGDNGDRAWLSNKLLMMTVAEHEWCLYKSLSGRSLEPAIRLVPQLKPFRIFIDLTGWDIDVPAGLGTDEGLFGLWKGESLKACVDAAQLFTTTDMARSVADSVKWSFFDRLLGRPTRVPAAVARWIDNWDHWMELCDAVRVTFRENKALGFVMYP